MATTSGRSVQSESDGIHVTFSKDHSLGLPGESKWISAGVARGLIARGIAVESEPARRKETIDPQEVVLAKAFPNGRGDGKPFFPVRFRILTTGDVFEADWTVALDRIRKGIAELV